MELLHWQWPLLLQGQKKKRNLCYISAVSLIGFNRLATLTPRTLVSSATTCMTVLVARYVTFARSFVIQSQYPCAFSTTCQLATTRSTVPSPSARVRTKCPWASMSQAAALRLGLYVSFLFFNAKETDLMAFHSYSNHLNRSARSLPFLTLVSSLSSQTSAYPQSNMHFAASPPKTSSCKTHSSSEIIPGTAAASASGSAKASSGSSGGAAKGSAGGDSDNAAQASGSASGSSGDSDSGAQVLASGCALSLVFGAALLFVMV